MIRIHLIIQMCAYAAVAFVFGFIGVIEVQHYKYVHPAILKALAAEDQGARTITAAQQLIGKADRSYELEIQNANDIGKKTGQVLDNLNGVAKNAQGAVTSLNDTVKGLNASQAKIADSTVATMAVAQKSIEGLQPVEDKTKDEIVALHTATNDLDTFLKSPDLIGTAHNVNVMTSEFAQTSTDFQNKFHAILYPPKCVGKLCALKRAWPIIKDGSQMMEPAYWGYEFVQAVKK